MRKYFAILGLLALLITLILGGIPNAMAQEPNASHKISSLLATQVAAKTRAVTTGGVQPALEASSRKGRVDILQAMGVKVEDLHKQAIFIHLAQEPSQSQIAELQSLGLTLYLDSWIPPLKNHPTGFIIADMPIDKLEELAAKDFVVTLDTAERFLEPLNDLATQKINADDVWNDTPGYDGTGIKIAVIDSGFQVGSGTGHAASHGDFPAMTAGTDYKDYSAYPTLDDDIANQVTGHGTHVAASALGRGTQSSGNIYKGSAPGATPVFLKIGGDVSSSASSAAIIGAMQDAVDVYSADVITMSYGGWSTYHDGSDEMSQAVDYAVDKGAVVFISAGNDANDDRHYSGTVAANTTTGFIQIDVTGAGTNNTALAYNLVWYDGTSTSNDLELEYYDSGQDLVASTDFIQTESSRGTESEYSYEDTYVGIGSSTYYLKVVNNSTNSQSFHIYYDSGYNGSGAGTVKFNAPDANYTIGSPAEADSAITVGAHVTRTSWTDYKGSGWTWGQTLDTIASFSSRGPRVDTGASPKPNIVAPGSAIISARDDDVYPLGPPPRSYDPAIIDNDGLNLDGSGPADYYVMQGTSMASPIAAGVAALILDKNPTWTPAQVRHALESTATGTASWNSTWGWGLIDAYDAVNSSLPAFESYREGYPGAGGAQDDLFSDFATENTVYMYSADLLPSHQYRVAYYDGINAKIATDDVDSDTNGDLSSQYTFRDTAPADQPGTWHVIVSERAHTPPSTYDSNWEYILTSDTFTVVASAIPEFPTVLAAMVALALSAGIYLWMRRKAAPVPA